MKVSAPGKLFISGEWAILEVKNPGIVTAIDKRVFVDIKKSKDEKIHIKIKDFKIHDLIAEFRDEKLQFEKHLSKREKKEVSFMKSAIETVLKYLPKWKPFKIECQSKEMSVNLNGERKEIGLGSSAASVVGTVAALLKFHGIDIKREETKNKIYKLSTIAHYLAQGKVGSAFDIAASTFGGLFLYKRFDSNWLLKQFEKDKSIEEIVELKWPGFFIEKLNIPDDFVLIVGWTGKSASTPTMVKKFYKWQSKNQKDCRIIFSKIANLTRKLVKVWRKEEKEEIIKLIRKNENYLKELGKKSKINIETKTLRKLSEIAKKYGAAGKLSGAGGGDCGIAISFNREIKDIIKRKWKESGIFLVDADISFNGVREEK